MTDFRNLKQIQNKKDDRSKLKFVTDEIKVDCA